MSTSDALADLRSVLQGNLSSGLDAGPRTPRSRRPAERAL
jgi:hypothetical protein